MITLFRMFRCWQLRAKWRLALWQFIDKQAMELINDPENLEKRLLDSFAKMIHESNSGGSDTQSS